MEPRIDVNIGIRGEPDAWVHSACLLCSNGGGLDIPVRDGHIVSPRGAAARPAIDGAVKGAIRPQLSEPQS